MFLQENTSAVGGGSLAQLSSHHQSPADPEAAVQAAEAMLEALGIDFSHGAVSKTPQRLVALCQELLAPYEFEATVFPNTRGYSELLLAQSIPFHSLCEQHLLPFYGIAHIGYVPGENLLGVSTFARLVKACSRGFQVQERMTTRIGLWLDQHLAPRSVSVLVEGVHSCMTACGVCSVEVSTTTMAFYGSALANADERREFLFLVRQEQ